MALRKSKKAGYLMSQVLPLNSYEKQMLRRMNLNPDDYLVKKRLNYVVILKHRHTGMIKYLDKRS